MQCKLQHILRLKYNPVAVVFSDHKPDNALQFKDGKWGCVMMMFAQAAKGKTAAFDRNTYGCVGGAVGLGFGNQYLNFTGGIECFYRFLSSGNASDPQGSKIAEETRQYIRDETYENFLHGEGYVKTPELVKKFVERMPIIDVPFEYVMFRPLAEVDEEAERPEVIIFPVNPDQLSALVVLANYARESNETVYAPFSAGCHSIGIFAYHEAKQDRARAVIGLTDISARIYTSRQLGKEIMTFSVPLKMFHEMEDNIAGSFLEKHSWQTLMKMNREE